MCTSWSRERSWLQERRGFTLLELILVCAIVAIIVTAVSASMSGFLGRNRLRSLAGRTAALAIFARSRALTAGHEVVMRVDRSNGEIALYEPTTEDGQELTLLGNEWVIRLPEGIVISALEVADEVVSEADITFFPNGSAQEAHLTLALHSRNAAGAAQAQTELSIKRITGRVKVE